MAVIDDRQMESSDGDNEVMLLLKIKWTGTTFMSKDGKTSRSSKKNMSPMNQKPH